MSQPLIVSASGIRGIVGETMTPELAARYGAAFAAWLTADGTAGPVRLGRDSRTSGALLADAAAAGVRAAGRTVVDCGITPTPTLLLGVRDDPEAAGGLLVTASHNPVEWNGLKLAGPGGGFLSPEAGAEVEEIFRAGPALRGWDALGGRETEAGAVEHHIGRILALELVDVDAVRDRRPHVALDCVHGAGGVIMPELLDRLGCRVDGIGLEPDGRFPRAPEPTAGNLGNLEALVRETGADVGLAVDPDVDRLSLVDETGRAVGEDWTLALAVEYVLDRRPGPVVTNLSSSQSIERAARRAGVAFERTPVGEVRVARRMQELGAVIGGEGNGGVMLPDLHLTRDAPLAAALVLSFLATRESGLATLIGERPGFVMERRRLERPAGPVAAVLERLHGAWTDAEADRRDGLRLAWPERGEWVHVRASGTEPVLRVIAEAPSARRARELADAAERRIEETD